MVQASRRKYHYIYKITREDGKYYIGMHSTDDLANDTYFGSGKRLRYSINKHGIEKHSKEIIEHCFTREILKEREKEIVNEELLSDPLCMNLKMGGEGGWDHQNSNPDIQRSKGQKGRNKVLWLRENDPLWKEKNSKQASENFKNAHKFGKIKYDTFTGRKHTEESIRKMKESSKGKRTLEKNPAFGKNWIYSKLENKSMMIHQNDLEKYLDLGWIRGRKIMPL